MPWHRIRSVLIAVLLVAACEEQQRVQRRAFVTPEHLMEMQASGGVLVELHGLPWPGATPEETIATLRMPEGKAAELRFREIAPRQGLIGSGERLVLHFNALGEPDPVKDCQARAPMKAGPGGDEFTVNATYCEGENWLVTAYTEADGVAAKDWLGYYLTMRELFGAMFRGQ